MTSTKTGATIIAMERRNSLLLVMVVAIGAIAVGLQAADEHNANYTTRILALPDHGQGNITMDYIAYDPKTGYVWVPAINIGSVDVVDTSNGSVREISGFATKELEVQGRKRTQGPAAYRLAMGWCTSVTGPAPVYAPLMQGLSRAKPVATSILRPTASSM